MRCVDCNTELESDIDGPDSPSSIPINVCILCHLKNEAQDLSRKCERCDNLVDIEFDDDGEPHQPPHKLCSYCFEDALEEYEIHRRERIARQNEY